MNVNQDTTTTMKPSFAFLLLRWAFIALLVFSSLFLLLWVARFTLTWIVLPAFVERHVRELGLLAGWEPDFIWMAVIAGMFLVSYLAQFVVRRDRRHRWAALGGLAALAIIWFAIHAWLTHGQLYDQHGQPLFYWGLTPSGEIYKRPQPGLNPFTNKPLLPASPEYLTLIRSRLREPLRQVDPSTNDWFSLNTGWPLLWWTRSPNGALEFHQRPAIHPRYRVELQPVTVELFREWEQAQARRKAEEAAEAERKASAQREEAARRLEMQRLNAEEARRQSEIAKAQQVADEAKRAAAESEQRAIAQAERAAREQTAREDAERSRQQQVTDRRAEEAVCPAESLQFLDFAHMLKQICPQLTAESFQPAVFTNEFYLRRFRFVGKVTEIRKDRRQVTFSTLTCGNLHCAVLATLTPETLETVRAKKESAFAGTLVDIQFFSGPMKLNGVPGRLCVISLGNTTAEHHQPAIPQPIATRTAAVVREPFFAPYSDFSTGNPPVQAAIGFTFNNTVRIVSSPLRFVTRSTGFRPPAVRYIYAPPVRAFVPVPGPYLTRQSFNSRYPLPGGEGRMRAAPCMTRQAPNVQRRPSR